MTSLASLELYHLPETKGTDHALSTLYQREYTQWWENLSTTSNLPLQAPRVFSSRFLLAGTQPFLGLLFLPFF